MIVSAINGDKTVAGGNGTMLAERHHGRCRLWIVSMALGCLKVVGLSYDKAE